MMRQHVANMHPRMQLLRGERAHALWSKTQKKRTTLHPVALYTVCNNAGLLRTRAYCDHCIPKPRPSSIISWPQLATNDRHTGPSRLYVTILSDAQCLRKELRIAKPVTDATVEITHTSFCSIRATTAADTRTRTQGSAAQK